MRNDHSQQEQQNSATYQTGVTHTPKRSSGPMAFLLVLTILLGGLASGLGILNVRLLWQLESQNQPSAPVNIDPGASTPSSTGILPVEDPDLPQVPQDRELLLTLSDGGSSGLDCQQTFEKNTDTLVQILSDFTHRVTSSTGIVLTSDGYILASAHAVTGAQRLYVNLPDGQQLRAALVGSDILTDLAVLYIDAQGLTAAEFGDSSTLQHCSQVYSLRDLQEERTNPLVAAMVTEPQYNIALGKTDVSLMQLDTGSIDGPVYNIYGQLVGLHVGGMRQFYDIHISSTQGYAIPSTTIRTVVSQLVAQGYVSGRPTLGIRTEPISKVYQQQLELPGGLWVHSAGEDPQGFLTGDILLALSGIPMADDEDLYRVLFDEGIGAAVTAIVRRGGKTISLQIRILDTAA